MCCLVWHHAFAASSSTGSFRLRPSFVIPHRFSIEPAMSALRGGVAHDEARGKVVIALA
jgi:hypothetical protein